VGRYGRALGGRTLTETLTIEELSGLAGRSVGPTEWLEVTQERIDQFAHSVDDTQWIHVDPARAAEGPFGTTVAHGFLTLTLAVRFWYEAVQVEDASLIVNYGLNRVRFPAPVPAGSRIRAAFDVQSVDEVSGGVQAAIGVTIEVDGSEKPASVAELLLRFLR
jgi:acyl dehydratase